MFSPMVKVLEDKSQILPSEICQIPFADSSDVLPADEDVSAGNTVNCGDTVQKCGLAGSAGAHDSYEFSLVNMEGDAVHGFCDISVISIIFFDMLKP